LAASKTFAGPAEEAVAAARASVERMRSGDFEAAIRESWDADAVLSAAFGLQYLDLTREQQQRAQAAFLKVLVAPFASAKLAALNKSVSANGVKYQVISDTVVIVRVEVVTDDRKFKSTET